jgi:hypothetical protein
MDAARETGASYCHAFCLFFYVAFFWVRCYKAIHAVYYSISNSLNPIGRVYYPLLPTRKWRAKMVFDFQPNQATVLITSIAILNFSERHGHDSE